eukprot:1154305-Pelagomonas_calceolata.AAC.1
MVSIAKQNGIEHLELHGGYTLTPEDCLVGGDALGHHKLLSDKESDCKRPRRVLLNAILQVCASILRPTEKIISWSVVSSGHLCREIPLPLESP